MRLLDTDIMVDIERGFPPAVAWLASLSEPPSLPCFVVMELAQDVKNKVQLAKVKRTARAFPLVWPQPNDCQLALSAFLQYRLSHSLDLLDALIGACAVGANATLCTFNIKHYKVFAGLNTEQPYKKK
jgi:predicted nucleic acid-binding protein